MPFLHVNTYIHRGRNPSPYISHSWGIFSICILLHFSVTNPVTSAQVVVWPAPRERKEEAETSAVVRLYFCNDFVISSPITNRYSREKEKWKIPIKFQTSLPPSKYFGCLLSSILVFYVWLFTFHLGVC